MKSRFSRIYIDFNFSAIIDLLAVWIKLFKEFQIKQRFSWYFDRPVYPEFHTNVCVKGSLKYYLWYLLATCISAGCRQMAATRTSRKPTGWKQPCLQQRQGKPSVEPASLLFLSWLFAAHRVAVNANRRCNRWQMAVVKEYHIRSRRIIHPAVVGSSAGAESCWTPKGIDPLRSWHY